MKCTYRCRLLSPGRIWSAVVVIRCARWDLLPVVYSISAAVSSIFRYLLSDIYNHTGGVFLGHLAVKDIHTLFLFCCGKAGAELGFDFIECI